MDKIATGSGQVPAKSTDDFVRDLVAEIVLFRIRALILEWQNGYCLRQKVGRARSACAPGDALTLGGRGEIGVALSPLVLDLTTD